MRVAHEKESPEPEKLAGLEIRRLREARGWSQQELARRMASFGYQWHQTMIARIEAGSRPLRVNELTDFAALFGVTILDLTIPKVSLEDAADEIARLEPELKAAAEKFESAEKAVDIKAGRLKELTDARDEAFFEHRRIQARLDYLRRRVASLTPPERGGDR